LPRSKNLEREKQVINIPLYEANEFMKRRIQLISKDAVLRIRELLIIARTNFPSVNGDMLVAYCDALDNAKQIDININFLLDMFGVEPLESVSVVNPKLDLGL
jgi:hypothetical protein